MRDALYIYRGNVLISIGDILNVKYSDGLDGVGLYLVVGMKKNDNGLWSIDVKPIKVNGRPDKSYFDSDLDDLYEKGELDVFQKVGR